MEEVGKKVATKAACVSGSTQIYVRVRTSTGTMHSYVHIVKRKKKDKQTST